MTCKFQFARTAAAVVLAVTSSAARASEQLFELPPVTVTGDLMATNRDRLPSSVSVLRPGEQSLPGNAQHFEGLAGRIPNLTWAGGTSRARFFQIRGIGEVSQFGNEIPASSVGFLIDDIDFTGIGSVAGLFDVSQVEVLRGPQAAAHGANALAGMVVVRTEDPSPDTRARLSASTGSQDLFSFGAATGGTLGPAGDSPLAYRLSVSQYRDNGFRDNRFLNRDDTNERDERSARFKLSLRPAPAFSLDFTLLYFDMDNGYDAWSLTNDSFVTTTDEPGRDEQETVAGGIRATWRINDGVEITYRGSVSDSDLLYGYDWDWSNPDELMMLYGPEVYWGTDITERTREVHSHDLRLGSSEAASGEGILAGWAAGLFHRDFEEKQDYFGIHSVYTTRTFAVYGQLRMDLSDRFGLTVALRGEDLEIDHIDDSGTRLGGSEQPWGGKLALEYRMDANHLLYASLDRGFKAGGVNLDNEIPAAFRIYETETLINYELGWKAWYPDPRLRVQFIAFYMDRDDIQVDSSLQLGDGNTFALYKDNAASGRNYGIELELEWMAAGGLAFHASLGLLQAEFDEYRYISPEDGQTIVDLDGHDQAYAPAFTWSAGVDYRAGNGFFAGLAAEGRDDLVFDVVNGQSIGGYSLVHLKAGYQTGAWTLSAWVDNLLDKRYDAHAFYFANEPPLYDQPRKWVSQGAPLQAGVTVEWEY
jgi:outer membrane receptor protein involved in Fe transport